METWYRCCLGPEFLDYLLGGRFEIAFGLSIPILEGACWLGGNDLDFII